jgi:tetratricopeptide (TPR) repeat protein
MSILPSPTTFRLRRPAIAVLLAACTLAAPAVHAQGNPAPPAGTPAPTTDPVLRAARLAEGGDIAGAIAELEAVRRSVPLSPRGNSLLGALHLQAGAPEQALAVLEPLAQREDADPAVLYNAGRAALALDRTDLAIGYLGRSYNRDPFSPAARTLGMLFVSQGQVVEAYRLLHPWALRAPADLEARIVAVSLALRLERFWEAEDLLEGLPVEDPGVRLLYGQTLLQSGDAAGALVQLELLWANRPPGMDLELRRSLAEARLAAGDAAGAREVLTPTSGHPSMTVLLATAQRAGGDARGAQATLAPLVASLPAEGTAVADPRLPAAVAAEQGRTALALGDIAGGIAALQRATRLHPTGQEAWAALAPALAQAGRAAEAQAAEAKLAELRAAKAAAASGQPGRTAAAGAPPTGAPAAGPPVSAASLEAHRLIVQGDLAGALERARAAIATDPADVPARMAEIRALLGMQRWEEARTAAEAALLLAPNNADLIYHHAATLIPLRQLVEAESELRRVLTIVPSHVAAMNDLAVVLVMVGRHGEARDLLRAILALNPDDAAARASLADVERQLAGGG